MACFERMFRSASARSEATAPSSAPHTNDSLSVASTPTIGISQSTPSAQRLAQHDRGEDTRIDRACSLHDLRERDGAVRCADGARQMADGVERADGQQRAYSRP